MHYFKKLHLCRPWYFLDFLKGKFLFRGICEKCICPITVVQMGWMSYQIMKKVVLEEDHPAFFGKLRTNNTERQLRVNSWVTSPWRLVRVVSWADILSFHLQFFALTSKPPYIFCSNCDIQEENLFKKEQKYLFPALMAGSESLQSLPLLLLKYNRVHKILYLGHIDT